MTGTQNHPGAENTGAANGRGDRNQTIPAGNYRTRGELHRRRARRAASFHLDRAARSTSNTTQSSNAYGRYVGQFNPLAAGQALDRIDAEQQTERAIRDTLMYVARRIERDDPREVLRRLAWVSQMLRDLIDSKEVA